MKDKQDVSPMCRLCDEREENISRIVAKGARRYFDIPLFRHLSEMVELLPYI